MGRSFAAAVLALAVLGAPGAAAMADDEPVAAEQVAGVTVDRDGWVVIVLVAIGLNDRMEVLPPDQRRHRSP